MNYEDRDHMTDRLLDAALARYSDAEPRNGLEQRILANLAEHSTRRAPVWNRLLWTASACAAALAFVIGISLLHQNKRPANPPAAHIAVPTNIQAQVPKLTSSISQPRPTTKGSRIPATRVIAKQVSSPHQSHFPALTGPTEQELLLMAYLNATPMHELLAVAAEQQQWRERVKNTLQPDEQTPAPAREVNDLRNSPPESGTTETSASSAR